MSDEISANKDIDNEVVVLANQWCLSQLSKGLSDQTLDNDNADIGPIKLASKGSLVMPLKRLFMI